MDEFIKYKQVFVLIRNLRNFIEHEVDPRKIKRVLKIIINPEEIRRVKVYPFRLYSALIEISRITPKSNRQIELIRLTKKYLVKVINNSQEFIPKFDGKNPIMIDVSGSMDNYISSNSKVTRVEIATLYGSLLSKRTNSPMIMFVSDFRMIIPDDNVISNIKEVTNLMDEVGNVTFTYKPIEYLIENKLYFDRIFVLTDMIVYDEYDGFGFINKIREYRRKLIRI